MTFPPSLLRLRVRTPEHSWPTLWLPLIIIWPLLFVLLVPLALVVLPIAIVLDRHLTAGAIQIAGALCAAICGLRGVHIDLVGRTTQLRIAFY